MKKVLIFFSALLLLGAASCSQKEDIENTNELPNVTENEGENPKEAEEPTPTENEGITENGNSNPPVNGNTSDNETDDNESEEPANESLEPTTYENNSFKDVSLTKNENGVNVTGKARVFEGVFQYAVVLKDEILIENHYQTAGAPAWGEFKFSIDKNLLKNPGTTLELFVYSAKDGSKIDVLPIILVKE